MNSLNCRKTVFSTPSSAKSVNLFICDVAPDVLHAEKNLLLLRYMYNTGKDWTTNEYCNEFVKKKSPVWQRNLLKGMESTSLIATHLPQPLHILNLVSVYAVKSYKEMYFRYVNHFFTLFSMGPDWLSVCKDTAWDTQCSVHIYTVRTITHHLPRMSGVLYCIVSSCKLSDAHGLKEYFTAVVVHCLGKNNGTYWG